MFHTPLLYDKFGAHWHLGFVSSVSFPVNKLLSQTTSSNRPSDAAGTEVDRTGPDQKQQLTKTGGWPPARRVATRKTATCRRQSGEELPRGNGVQGAGPHAPSAALLCQGFVWPTNSAPASPAAPVRVPSAALRGWGDDAALRGSVSASISSHPGVNPSRCIYKTHWSQNHWHLSFCCPNAGAVLSGPQHPGGIAHSSREAGHRRGHSTPGASPTAPVRQGTGEEAAPWDHR